MTRNPEEIVAGLAAGDAQVLADLFDEHRDRLVRMVELRLDPRLRNRIDPEDIVQEAYVDAAKRIDTFDGETTMAALFVWLRLIVGQTMIDVHRRHLGAKMRDARRERSLPAMRADSASLSGLFLGHLTSPSQAAIRAEAGARLEEALEQMDEIDREVLMLRHFEELTNGEVATVLGLQKSAASNRYVRALSRLKAILGSFPGLDGSPGGG